MILVVDHSHSHFIFDHIADGNTSQVYIPPWNPLKVNDIGL